MPEAKIAVIGGTGLYEIEGMTDVEEVEINQTTGSVKIYYDPDHIDAGHSLNLLKYNDLFDENQVVAQEEYLSSTGQKAGMRVSALYTRNP